MIDNITLDNRFTNLGSRIDIPKSRISSVENIFNTLRDNVTDNNGDSDI